MALEKLRLYLDGNLYAAMARRGWQWRRYSPRVRHRRVRCLATAAHLNLCLILLARIVSLLALSRSHCLAALLHCLARFAFARIVSRTFCRGRKNHLVAH